MRFLQYPSAIAGLVPPLLASATPPIAFTSSNFSIQGARDTISGQDYFLGIPFAKPPIGALRFKPPVPWSPGNTAVFNATQYGDSCIQLVPFTTNPVSEDCLTLNIRKPTNVTEKLPVMVWIYGGGFYAGDSFHYQGKEFLARAMKIGKPIIYVAMNYRLGVYGFPPGKAAGEAGAINLGFKDQRLALEWVQRNIKHFGGDPEKVTIFGESGGAMSSAYQTFYKGGKIGGVFRGMILQSGAPHSLRVPRYDNDVREAGFQFIANATGCAKITDQFECVRNVPEQLLTQASKDVLNVPAKYALGSPGPWLFGPTRAPKDDFFPDYIPRLMHEGKFAKVPFISGAQLDEGTLFADGPNVTLTTDQDILDMLTARLPGNYYGISNTTAIKRMLKYYSTDPATGSPYGTSQETFGRGAQYKRFASISGDLAPRHDHLRTANMYGINTWSYVMKEPPVVRVVPAHGIYHGSDMLFIMQQASVVNPNVTAATVELQETIGDYWINFAYDLNPNPKGSKLPYWPRYGRDQESMQLLASNVTSFADNERKKSIDFIINDQGLFDRA